MPTRLTTTPAHLVRSYAPMSQAARPTPRSSVALQALPPDPGVAGSPALIAGLPDSRAVVVAGPPLSARLPSSGSIGEPALPT